MRNIEQYIPLDKSWIIRMGILDLANGYSDINFFLENQKDLSDDLKALKEALKNWGQDKPVNVGESGTLYRFLKFVSWKKGLDKEFVTQGTLKDRDIANDSKIIGYSTEELLKLDNGTSQWASAAVLCGSKERIDKPPYKLNLTYEAVEYWKDRRRKGESWEPRLDKTITRQAEAFMGILETGETDFTPEQAEDYCFARPFDLIDAKKGESLWPSLRGHESDRIEEMERELMNYSQGKEISSKDHRVVQAIAMKGRVDRKEVRFKYPNAVNKTWPQFWEFLSSV